MSHELKAHYLASRIKKAIYCHLDENDMRRAFRHIEKWNRVRILAYPGESRWTLGQMVDDWYESRCFEAKL